MKIGIVGHGADKFTREKAKEAISVIRTLLNRYEATAVVSGRSPVGGVDIWAETVGTEFGLEPIIYVPEIYQWNPPVGYGYKQRNLDIARTSDVVHVIVVSEYPPDYISRRWPTCYHCDLTDHVKSGGCWTGRKAIEMGKNSVWHII